MSQMVAITRNGTRLEQLKELALVIAAEIDAESKATNYQKEQKGSQHSMAQLARQYRETIKEISELEGDDDGVDAIAQLIAKHDSQG